MRNLLERLNPEIDTEFARIAALPGAAKSAGEIRKELMDRITPKMKEAKGLLPRE
ncbi:MAG: hypothetical protein NTZ85_09365 [Bacteroidia bacterium]|nr:hypothetical protein [Bacteroidia bacterium]